MTFTGPAHTRRAHAHARSNSALGPPPLAAATRRPRRARLDRIRDSLSHRPSPAVCCARYARRSTSSKCRRSAVAAENAKMVRCSQGARTPRPARPAQPLQHACAPREPTRLRHAPRVCAQVQGVHLLQLPQPTRGPAKKSGGHMAGRRRARSVRRACRGPSPACARERGCARRLRVSRAPAVRADKAGRAPWRAVRVQRN